MHDTAFKGLQRDFSNRGTRELMIIQSQLFLKTKDSQVFFCKRASKIFKDKLIQVLAILKPF